jgi:hypothetical protein
LERHVSRVALSEDYHNKCLEFRPIDQN